MLVKLQINFLTINKEYIKKWFYLLQRDLIPNSECLITGNVKVQEVYIAVVTMIVVPKTEKISNNVLV
tara:strand:+ start:1457 stop:1660 length:204 start_codon:yes stop_codon:yes gene_type:complete